MSSTLHNKVPKLRFPGFEGEWEEKKLKEVSKFWNGKGHEQDIDNEGKYIVINSKFVSTNGRIAKYSNKQISPLKKDDIAIVMSDIPNGKAIGKCFLVDKNEIYTLNQRIGGIKSEEVISSFLIRIINRNKYFLEFDNGVSQTNLRKEEVLACPIIFPSLPEQQKIASFLSSVDSWIENLRAQKEALEAYKKGMMQRIFSSKGGQAPEIRFKDENGEEFGEWEEKRLGDVCDVKGGKRIPLGYSLQSENNGFPYITVSDMNHGSVSLKNIMYVPAAVVNQIKNYTISSKDIYISVAGTLGLVGVIPESLENANLTENADKLTNIKCNKDFLLQFLKGDKLKKLIESTKTSNAQPKLAIYSLKSLSLDFPSMKEQYKIADFLQSFDRLIEEKEEQVKMAEEWKKGVMQGVFV